MSTVTSWVGRARNSVQLHVFCWPRRPTEKVHWSRAVCGVGPADRTGKSLVTYWPGGTRPAFSAGSWRLRWNPRETGLMTAILPYVSPGDTWNRRGTAWPLTRGVTVRSTRRRRAGGHRADGLTARMVAERMPGAASWVNVTDASVKPAAASPSRYSVWDGAPAMHPT